MREEFMILGQGCKYSKDCKKTQLNNNCLVVAPSGAGKTMSIAMPVLLETQHSSTIVSISKRKLFHLFQPYFEKMGYRVIDLINKKCFSDTA